MFPLKTNIFLYVGQAWVSGKLCVCVPMFAICEIQITLPFVYPLHLIYEQWRVRNEVPKRHTLLNKSHKGIYRHTLGKQPALWKECCDTSCGNHCTFNANCTFERENLHFGNVRQYSLVNIAKLNLQYDCYLKPKCNVYYCTESFTTRLKWQCKKELQKTTVKAEMFNKQAFYLSLEWGWLTLVCSTMPSIYLNLRLSLVQHNMMAVAGYCKLFLY